MMLVWVGLAVDGWLCLAASLAWANGVMELGKRALLASDGCSGYCHLDRLKNSP